MDTMMFCPGSYMDLERPHGSVVKCPNCDQRVATEPYSGYLRAYGQVGPVRWVEVVKIVPHPPT